jgi:mevalonate pyrophosphate decarboxylase
METGQEKELSVDAVLAMDICIDSTNNFNTAAGLASSSSGLSCLGVALASLYGLPKHKVDFSLLARLGSGSAVRSVYGGFVVWNKGYDDAELQGIRQGDSEVIERVSKKSIAEQVTFDDASTLDYWLDNLCILVCVVKPEQG